MKKLIFLAVVGVFVFTGCSAKYDTIANKDISVKVRSIWADVDYDSRVSEDPKPLKPLADIEYNGFEPLEPIVPPR